MSAYFNVDLKMAFIAMKFQVLSVVTASCFAIAFSVIPDDNSHYVEGESRYIWMSDDEGVPHLVDLQLPVNQELLQTRDSDDIHYWLFTRQNPMDRQVIIPGNTNSIRFSNYRNDKPLKLVLHGWNTNGNSDLIRQIAVAFLANQNCNVLIVDWSKAASAPYTMAVNDVPRIGQIMGNFLTWLLNTTGGNWNNVHLVGASLGAHVVGIIGRETGSRVARISGLDPAGPLWTTNPNALNANDGQYVEGIHTDGGLIGIFNRVGHADFYPNGGRYPQPGCIIIPCSHIQANTFFASSLYTNHFVGRQCTDLSQVSNPNQCNGSVLMMGNGILTKRGSGIFALSTGASWPY